MSILPFRNLGKLGVYTDVDPFDLPIGAYSMGVNARFEDNKISRAPVFRTVGTLTSSIPKHAIGFRESGGSARLFVFDSLGHPYSVTPGGGASVSTSDMAPVGYTDTSSNEPFTSATINNIVYVNREDRVPWFVAKSGSAFATLTNWNTLWRTKSIRTVNGQVVAINMQENGISYPNRVRWSDFSVWGTVPGTWTAGTTNSAGSTDLTDLSDELIDGMPLRDRMVLYSGSEVWLMEPNGSSLVFSFRRILNGPGILNQNCAVEVDGVHYVFGANEIYKHDGVQKISVSRGRVNSFIYNNMNRGLSKQFFVFHNYKLNELYFCYVSNDSFAKWPAGGSTGCNRAAVYNYRADTWYFYDLPYVNHFALASVNGSATYSSITGTYDSLSSTYSSFTDTSSFATVALCSSYSPWSGRINDFEPYATPSSTNPVSASETPPVFINQVDIDLDEMQVPLRGYKVVRSVYPEGRIEGTVPLSFQIALRNNANDALLYDDVQTYDGLTNYKLDYNESGRYISYKMAYDSPLPFTLSGLDFDIVVLGQR